MTFPKNVQNQFSSMYDPILRPPDPFFGQNGVKKKIENFRKFAEILPIFPFKGPRISPHFYAFKGRSMVFWVKFLYDGCKSCILDESLVFVCYPRPKV